MPELTYLVGRRNAKNTPWNGERDALLAQLWAEGYSASQIADRIRGVVVSRMAVIGRVHRLELPPRKMRQPAHRPRRTASVPKPPAPPPKPVPPPPPPQPGAPKMRRLKLVELKPHDCRWPVGEGGDEIRFCGADAASGEVYCPFHQRMARGRRKQE